MNALAFLLAGSTLLGRPFAASFEGGDVDRTDLRLCCEKIMNSGQRVWFLSDRNGKMKLQVKGIYLHGAALFFFLQLTNRSSGDYAIDGIHFRPSAKDGGILAGRPELEPVFVYDSAKTIPGNSRAASIFVLPRFTLPPGGKLWIEVREHNGGRLLRIPVGNWMLARARLI